MNINRFYLSKLLKEGIIKRIKRGLYRSCEHNFGHELVEIAKIVPKGVICLESAVEYHNLSTNIPNCYKVAIPHKSKIILPEYPPIKLQYFTSKFYELGIINIELDKTILKIYDLEKTICDIYRYKQRLDGVLYQEVIKAYFKRDDKNLTKLFDYTQSLGIFKRLKKSLELII